MLKLFFFELRFVRNVGDCEDKSVKFHPTLKYVRDV